jgi:RNA polymerase sigma-70 factor, ECF subfamily
MTGIGDDAGIAREPPQRTDGQTKQQEVDVGLPGQEWTGCMVCHLRKVWNGHRMRGQLRTMLPALQSFALTLTHSQHDADDLVQTACERALQLSNRGQSAERLQNDMFHAMRMIWIDELRGRQIHDHHAEDERLSVQRSFAHDSEGQAQHRALLRDVEQAILRLSGVERRLVELVCVQGLSYKEAADVTGVPIGTVMSRLSRARTRLMEQVKMDGYASEGSMRMLQPCWP